jgi:hypothetical protein
MHPLQAAWKWAVKHNKFESEADKQQHYRDLAEEHEEFFDLLEGKLYSYPQQFWTRKLVFHIISIHNRECCASPEDEIHIVDPRDSDIEFVQAIDDFYADLKKFDDVRNALMATDEKYAQASPKQQRKVLGHVKTSKDLWRVSYQSILAKMSAHYRDIREDENSFPGLMNASLSDPIWDYIAQLTDKIEKDLREDVSDVSNSTGLDGPEDFGEEDNRSDASGETEFTSVRDNSNCSVPEGDDNFPKTWCLRSNSTERYSMTEIILINRLKEILYAKYIAEPIIREIGEKTNAALKQLVSLANGKQVDAKLATAKFPRPPENESAFSDDSMAWRVAIYIKELKKYNFEVEKQILELSKKLIERYELLQEKGEDQGVFKHMRNVRDLSSRYACDLKSYRYQQGHRLALDPGVLKWSKIIVQLEEGDEAVAKIVEEADYPYKTNIDFGNSINYILEMGHHRFAFQVANALFEYAKALITGAPIDHRILMACSWFLEEDQIARKGIARELGIEITYPPSNEERSLRLDDNSHCLVFFDLMINTFSGIKNYRQINTTHLIALDVFSKLGSAGAGLEAIGVEPTDPSISEESAYKELAGILVKARTVEGVEKCLLRLLKNYAWCADISIGREMDDRLLAELESIREQAKGKVDAEPEIDDTLDVENINDWGYSGYVAVMARIYAHMARKFGKEIDIEVLSEVTALIEQANKKAVEDEIEGGHVAGLCTCDDCLSEAADFECGRGRCDHPVPIALRGLDEEGKSGEIDTKIEFEQSKGLQSNAATGGLQDESITIESPSVEDIAENAVAAEVEEVSNPP